jgi:hypothetical protein
MTCSYFMQDGATAHTGNHYINADKSLAFEMNPVSSKDNASPHKAATTHQKLADLHFEVLKHPTYSSDLAPSGYYLFPSVFIKPKTYQPSHKMRCLKTGR